MGVIDVIATVRTEKGEFPNDTVEMPCASLMIDIQHCFFVDHIVELHVIFCGQTKMNIIRVRYSLVYGEAKDRQKTLGCRNIELEACSRALREEIDSSFLNRHGISFKNEFADISKVSFNPTTQRIERPGLLRRIGYSRLSGHTRPGLMGGITGNGGLAYWNN